MSEPTAGRRVCGAGGCTNTNPPKTYAEREKCFYDGTPCTTSPGGTPKKGDRD